MGVPSFPPGGAATPVVGDLVWVTFEGGGTDDPTWDAGAAPDPDAAPADGHVAGTERSSPTTSTRWRSTG